MREEFPTRFAILTGGRGVMEVYPQALSDAQTGTFTPVTGDEIRPGDSNIDDALAWLRQQQHADGYWQDLPHTRIRDTTAVLTTLRRLDEQFSNAGTALDWLKNHTGSNLDDLARRVQTLNALGFNTGTLSSSFLISATAMAAGGLRPATPAIPGTPRWHLRALPGSRSDSGIQTAIDYLHASQNSDGGWSSITAGPGRIALTATVLEALAAKDATDPVAASAIDWLAARQQADGGFGDGDSSVLDTALALRALIALDAVGHIDSELAIQLSAQSPEHLRQLGRQRLYHCSGGMAAETIRVSQLVCGESTDHHAGAAA